MRRLLLPLLAIVVLALVPLTACSLPGAGMLRDKGSAGDTRSGSGGTRASQAKDRRPRTPTMVVLDASGSMKVQDAPGQRFAAAQKAVVDMTASLRKGHPIGLMTYGTRTGNSEADKPAGCRDVTRVLPVGPLDKSTYDAAVTALRPRGYTPIGTALQQAAAALPTKGKRAIVLISDGVDTCAPPAPCDVARALHKTQPDLAISTVGFRVGGDAQAQLECIAEATGGSYLDATSGPVLGSRLAALFDPEAVARSIQPTGYRDVELGMTAAQTRTATGTRASRSSRAALGKVPAKGRVEIRYVDCTLVFQDGVVVAIRSTKKHSVSTVDGTTVGDQVSAVLATYGSSYSLPQPGVIQVPADTVAGTGYEIRYDGPTGAATPTGTVTTITLCRCAPTLGIGMVAFSGAVTDGGPSIWNGERIVRAHGLLAPQPESAPTEASDLEPIGFIHGRALFVNHEGAHYHVQSLHLVDPSTGQQATAVACSACDATFIDGDRIVAMAGYLNEIYIFDQNLKAVRTISVDGSQFADPEAGWDGYGEPEPDFDGAGVADDSYYVLAHAREQEGDSGASPRMFRLDDAGRVAASSADLSVDYGSRIALGGNRAWIAESNGSIRGLDATTLKLALELAQPGIGTAHTPIGALYPFGDDSLMVTQGAVWTYRDANWQQDRFDGGGALCVGDVGDMRVVGSASSDDSGTLTQFRGTSILRQTQIPGTGDDGLAKCVVDAPPNMHNR